MRHCSAITLQFLCRTLQCGNASQLRHGMKGPILMAVVQYLYHSCGLGMAQVISTTGTSMSMQPYDMDIGMPWFQNHNAILTRAYFACLRLGRSTPRLVTLALESGPLDVDSHGVLQH